MIMTKDDEVETNPYVQLCERKAGQQNQLLLLIDRSLIYLTILLDLLARSSHKWWRIGLTLTPLPPLKQKPSPKNW